MLAAFYERQDAARDVLRIEEMPMPTPGPGEVRGGQPLRDTVAAHEAVESGKVIGNVVLEIA